MIPIIDMHCDTIMVVHRNKLHGAADGLRSNEHHIDLDKLKRGGYMCQNMALYTDMGDWADSPSPYTDKLVGSTYSGPTECALAMSDVFDAEVQANSDLVASAFTAADIEANFGAGKLSVLKTVEEGAAFAGSVDILRQFYDRGVRMTTLTWNYENELGYPNYFDWANGRSTPDTERGLKPAGKEIVSACKDLGIIVDISHLNDAGIWDVFDIMGTGTPIVASHSNARAVTNHARNLSDEMLRALAECGGVAGINYCADFINDRHDNMTTLADMVAHIRHMENVAGIESIGLGSDFDGIENQLEFGDASGMQALAMALEQAGYSQDKIEKIFYKNVLRVYSDILR